jgi:hypothetical protein
VRVIVVGSGIGGSSAAIGLRGAGRARPRLILCVLAGSSCLVVGCGSSNDSAEPSAGRLWTPAQAASISSIRGLPVRVRQCHGRGEKAKRYRSFRCVAGARAAGDRYDSIGVLYVLEPLGSYRGPTSPHRLRDVRFIGGPGIP